MREVFEQVLLLLGGNTIERDMSELQLGFLLIEGGALGGSHCLRQSTLYMLFNLFDMQHGGIVATLYKFIDR